MENPLTGDGIKDWLDAEVRKARIAKAKKYVEDTSIDTELFAPPRGCLHIIIDTGFRLKSHGIVLRSISTPTMQAFYGD